jgi:alkylation response protein AidB-like acyl-CoA dehydrogenase
MVDNAELMADDVEQLRELRTLVVREDYAASVVTADRNAQMAVDNVRALQAIGITGLAVDKRFGDAGPPPALLVEVMEVLGATDASTAVALNMHYGGARTLARIAPFPRRDEALAAIRANDATICGAFSNPSQELDSRRARLSCRLEGDEFVLNGRAGFGSMSDAAAYAMLGGVVEDSDPEDPLIMMTVGRFGEPGLVKHSNWSAMGMRGTGSNDIECQDFRVARGDCLVVPRSSLRQSRQSDVAVVAFGIAGIWLGLAQAAFDFTVDHVQRRFGYMAEGTFNPSIAGFRADEAWAQVALGNMDHWLGTGRGLLQSTVTRLGAEEDVPAQDLVRTLYHLRRMSEEVSMGAMKVCGAHGFVTSQPLERIFRDSVGGIVMAWKTDQLQHTLGVGALGRPITFTGPAGT